jgi:8-oxo-dGTP diphosphatase
MDRTEKAELTVLCMIYKDNKLLLQERIKEDWKGLTFPGGHVEKEEFDSDRYQEFIYERNPEQEELDWRIQRY